MNAHEKLIHDLEEANAPEEMIQNARDGLYHDFKSDHPAPKHALLTHCTVEGLHDIASEAINGTYDNRSD